MKTSLKTLSLIFGLLFAGQLFAANLSTLKANGIVGEDANGYLALVVSSASAEDKAFIDSVNAKRKAIYQNQATKNDLSMSKIQAIAGKRNFEKTKAGNYIKLAGKWKKK